jgi:hypothetical protein
VTVIRFGTINGGFGLLHQACLTQDIQQSVPCDAVVVAHRRSNPVFGVGLMEAIPDSEIMLGVKNGVDGIFVDQRC